MSSFVSLALSNAALATVLAVFAAVLARCCRRPAVRHAMWLLVLLKLLTPPLVPLTVTWPRSEESGPPPPGETQPAAVALPSDLEPSEPIKPEIETDFTNPRREQRPPSPVLRADDVLVAIWLGGAFLWWTVAAVRLRRFQRLLRQASPAPAEVQKQARRLAALLGLRRCPPVVFISAPLSPMLWALGFSPRLLVPAELWHKLTAEQQDTLLAHELAHLRRGDPWVRRLELLVLGLYWWHPVVWWARRRLQEAEEECCDALVIAALPDAAPAYAAVLVETVAFLSHSRTAAPIGASGAGHVPLLKRRLTMILSEPSSRKPSRITFWSILGLGALLLPLAPQAARTEAPEKPQQEGSNYQVGFPRAMTWKADNIHDHEFIKAKDCASCHVVPMAGHDWNAKPQSWREAHDEIVRLLDEIKTRRTRLQETEDRLKRALDSLKKLEPRPESAFPAHPKDYRVEPVQPTKWNVTWAEALFNRRFVELPPVKQGIGFGGIKFVMTNHGKQLVHIDNIRTSSASLSARATQPELKPGETAEIKAELDTKRFIGHKNFQITVTFDKPDRQEVTLEVRADVEAAAPAKPQSPERLQELEKKLDELRKEMDNLRREMRPGPRRDP